MHLVRTVRIVSVVCLALLLVSQSSPVLSQETSRQAQSEIDGIENDLARTTDRYADITAAIERLNDQIEVLEQDIDEQNADMDESSAVLNRRLAGIYKHGQFGLLEVFIGSRSLADLTENLNMLTRVTRQDLGLIRAAGERRRALEESRGQLEKSRAEQTQLLADLAQTKYEIGSRLREKQDLLARLQAEESAQAPSAAGSAPRPAQPSPNPHLSRSAEGIATWYNYTGAYTAAHNTLSLGTLVRVTNLGNGQQVWVEIVDRGIAGSAIIDLEEIAFAAIADPGEGVCYVRIEW